MKRAFKFITSALATLAIALIPALSVPQTETAAAATYHTTTATGYKQASDVKYVTVGDYTVNWGARGEDCTFLSSRALSFYTGSNTYEMLSQKTGSSTQSKVPSSALYNALQTFMISNHSKQTSYNGTKSLYRYTDCVNNGYSSYISSFYSGTKIGPTWEDQSPGWNREHTWPKSKGIGEGSVAANDIMMLRPTATSENSSRGNTAYGESGGYYDPNGEGANLRGDCARIVLYMYVRWESLNTTSYMWNKNGVMESMDVLLKWMQEDPVDTWEMGRNDAVQSITGTRNVFVDYPEFAWLLFGQSAPTGMNTPSGIANGGTVVPPVVTPDDSTSSDNSDSTPDDSSFGTVDPTPDVQGNVLATFEFGENGSAHVDGPQMETNYVYEDGKYSLTFTNTTKVFKECFDAMGNSCIKFGSGSSVGSATFTVPDDVESVVFRIAKYKAKSSTIVINGLECTPTVSSDNGEYEEFVIDTSSTKTVSLATVSGATRVMIDSVTFLGADLPEPDDSSSDTTSDSSSDTTSDTASDTTSDTASDATSDTTTNSSSSDSDSAPVVSIVGCGATVGISALGILLLTSGVLLIKKKED